jgi:hypothetical protein
MNGPPFSNSIERETKQMPGIGREGGRLRKPSGLEEELAYYKAIVEIGKLTTDKSNYLGIVARIDDQLLAYARTLKEFMGWKPLAELLGLTEGQARLMLGGIGDEDANEG